MKIVLASTSKYRAAQLRRLGLEFEAHAPGVNEDLRKAEGLPPIALAQALAKDKALALSERFSDAVIIGGDQLVAFENEVLGKPGSIKGAEAQLGRLAGREHLLVTAVAIYFQGKVYPHTDLTRLSMRPLEAEAISRYVAQDQPIDCAGAYKLEEAGISLFEKIVSEDHSAVTGLPLLAVTRILSGLSVAIP